MAGNVIFIEDGGRLIPVEHSSICVCEAARHKCIIHTTSKHSYFYPMTLKELEDTLCKETFRRIHDKYLINIDQIKEVFRYKRRMYIMKNGMSVQASKRMNSEFNPK